MAHPSIWSSSSFIRELRQSATIDSMPELFGRASIRKSLFRFNATSGRRSWRALVSSHFDRDLNVRIRAKASIHNLMNASEGSHPYENLLGDLTLRNYLYQLLNAARQHHQIWYAIDPTAPRLTQSLDWSSPIGDVRVALGAQALTSLYCVSEFIWKAE